MALRYLVLASRGKAIDPNRIQVIERLTGLQAKLCGDDLVVLTDGNRSPHKIGHNMGFIIGDLFHRHGAGASIDRLAESDAFAIAEEPAQQLLSRYWGAYLAVWRRPAGEIKALRDPSGLLPCCITVAADLVAFASDPLQLVEAGLLQAAIDWTGVATTLYVDDLPQPRTGLEAVGDLLAGTVATVDSGGCSQSTCWSPWDHVDFDPGASTLEQIERLRRAVDQAARGWASTFDKSVLAVSGGLDSSILAACLASQGNVDCLTLRSSDPRGDETEYAEALCAALSLPLTCRDYRLEAADIRRSAVAHLPRPGARTQMIAYDAAVNEQVAASSAKALFSGAGGDNVFYSTRSVRPLVDRYLATGLSGGLLDTLRDISQITEASIWQVARRAFTFSRGPAPKYKWRFDDQFLHSDWDELQRSELTHPWLDAPRDALPGKVGHVAMMTRAQHYLHGYDRRLPFTAIAPLLSQPVVETALAIPSWLACEGGTDRSVARRAFAPRLPEKIVQRKTKGGPDGFAIEILRANLGEVRQRLLGGALAAHNLIDVSKVEMALANDAFAAGTTYVRLLLLLDTEAWVEAWQEVAANQIGSNSKRLV